MLAIVTPFTLAGRFLNVAEAPGAVANPQVLAMLRLDDPSVRDDETPWCSAFVNYVAWLLDLPRSRSLRARSWLTIGAPIAWTEARAAFDVVVLSRGDHAPPATNLYAPGHVGFFSRLDLINGRVQLLGGNQGNRVCLAWFPTARILDVRRLA